MKKFYCLIVLTLVTLTFSCKDDDENGGKNQNPAQAEIGSVTTALEAVPGMGTFAESLKQLDLSNVDGKEFTLFGISDAALSLRSTATNLISSDELKRHVVVGKFNAERLKSLKKIKALSGDSLDITVNGNAISINGIAIDSVKVVANSIVFFVNKLIPRVAEKTVVFQVWSWNDAWSPENNSEALKANEATIKIYNQANSSLVATLTTDTAGRAAFNQVPDLTYYYTVEKGDQKTLYKGFSVYGIITTQAQAQALTVTYPSGYTKKPGSLLLTDINGDGKIDDNDKTTTASISITGQNEVVHLISDKYVWPVEALIPDSISLQSMNEFSQLRNRASNFFSIFDSNFSSMDTRAKLTVSDARLDSLWINSYKAIKQINTCLEIEGLESETQSLYRSDLNLWRAMLHLQLSLMFGDVPILSSSALDINSLPRSKVDDVYNLALADLERAYQTTSLNLMKANILNNIVLIHLMKKDYARALEKANVIINSGTINATNAKDAYLRTLLFKLEALVELGNITDARATFNLFESVTTGTQTANATLEFIRTNSRYIFNKYSGDIGIRYANVIRWGENASWVVMYKLLPIPTSALNNNSRLTQNPGW